VKLFESIKGSQEFIKSTVILFVAPHKLVTMLEEMKGVLGDVGIVLCRELTKVHEEIRREKISEALGYFEKRNPKGEFVLLFNLSL
jgi:16S rRNA (cytidine1402-2'-O)-methyltransferase